MSFQVRPSITHRPIKESVPNAITRENQDLEFQREQARLEQIRQARANQIQARGQKMWGDSSERAQMNERERMEINRIAEEKRKIQENENNRRAQQEAEIARIRAERDQKERQRQEARKEYMSHIRDYNQYKSEEQKIVSKYDNVDRIEKERNMGSSLLDQFGKHAY
jgi:hypothetical protein